MPTLREWLREATAQLAAAGVVSPEVDARALLQHVLKLSASGLLLRAHDAVPAEQQARLSELLARRAARVPLQHLLGEVEWGGVQLRTDRRALVPRPETEWLLHLALQDLTGGAARVLDVGTGTGALALGLKAARPGAQVYATDLSAEAMSLAQENARLMGVDVQFAEGHLLAGLPGPFDLIVSNPPYLPAGDQAAADPEVRHDPPLALYAGPDGLDVARPLATEARAALAPGAPLWLELDPRNAALFAAELRAAGWAAAVHPDLTGRERFVRAVLSARSQPRETMPGV
ncbi:peptide chain release factor N(5)-glutamine methyltransferase [Deinococcus hohokamensis]|uniref:Release factor glutamine methyltransferase n=1 Tax=Deinococcus hohokamensis TaxID=309883 RepID=A0ABV9IC70_9DEIO